ncbi:Nephronectin [Trichinella zimbabwensis]|uniref:Nephronectin n=1 Tax=Trichinella zimbabwensis TaxID=268475 RepID=A0A0V1GVX3_9BILA|nr:Nephronectin [Trichinella zimbabwensis]
MNFVRRALIFLFIALLFTFLIPPDVEGSVSWKSAIKNRVLKTWKKSRGAWKLAQKGFRFVAPVSYRIKYDYAQYNLRMSRDDMIRVLCELGRAAFYIRIFKIHGKDTRREVKPIPLSSFPDPPLMHVHPVLQDPCTTSFFACVATIAKAFDHSQFANPEMFTKAHSSVSERWQEVDQLDDSSYFPPMADMDDYFVFGTSAMYFMCWMTMLQLPLLRHLPYCSYTDKWFIGFNKHFYSYIQPSAKVNSTYLIDFLDEEPFRCALFSFCPDPCCERRSVHQASCDHDPLNYCTKQGLSGCHLDLNENTNFFDLIQNRLNSSCSCPEHGMRYDPNALMCVDVDECGEGTAVCSKFNTDCVNTVGGYICVCRAGFKESNFGCVVNLDPIDDVVVIATANASQLSSPFYCPLITDNDSENGIQLRYMHPYGYDYGLGYFPVDYAYGYGYGMGYPYYGGYYMPGVYQPYMYGYGGYPTMPGGNIGNVGGGGGGINPGVGQPGVPGGGAMQPNPNVGGVGGGMNPGVGQPGVPGGGAMPPNPNVGGVGGGMNPGVGQPGVPGGGAMPPNPNVGGVGGGMNPGVGQPGVPGGGAMPPNPNVGGVGGGMNPGVGQPGNMPNFPGQNGQSLPNDDGKLPNAPGPQNPVYPPPINAAPQMPGMENNKQNQPNPPTANGAPTPGADGDSPKNKPGSGSPTTPNNKPPAKNDIPPGWDNIFSFLNAAGSSNQKSG